MAEFDDVSNEERLQIAQHFLLSSPPGQFHEVLKDVQLLLPEGLMTDQLTRGIARAYNTKVCKVVTAPSGTKNVLCAAAELDATHYVDAATGDPFAVDHLTLATTAAADGCARPHAAGSSSEQRRLQLQAGVTAYLSEAYPAEDSAGSVVATKDGASWTVTLAGEKTNLRNFWSGRFTSAWTVTLEGADLASLSLADTQQPVTVTVTVTGDVRVHAHYFEDGNVQMQTHRHFPATKVTINRPDSDFAGPIVAHIRDCERALEKGLADMYVNMNEETFKQMRRLMPVTRNKMEWNINSVKMVRQLKK